ncbi:polysaccharide pyruvyl transferase family protein [Sulfitobacter sp. 1A05707]|uniref:polysaccharide pyruvyl transferase family protein n=1 Tax=Sulfitobacter sp. 1A05707 TaxID=3368560 RepID=UPI00374685F3
MTRSNKKAIVAPQNTDLNKGDQCLNVNAVRFLERRGYEASVLEVAAGPEHARRQKHQTQHVLDLLQNPMRHPARSGRTDGRGAVLRQAVYGFMDMIVYGASAFGPKYISRFLHPKFVRRLEETDVVFSKGGGFFHSANGLRGFYYLFFVSYIFLLARKYDCETAFLPNSFGPFTSRWDKFLAKRVLKECKVVYTREEISHDYLNSMGIKNTLAPDLAFLTPPREPESCNGKIGVTVRPWRGVGRETYERYLQEIANLIHNRPDHTFVLVAQSFGPSEHEDDRIAIHEILERLKDCSNVETIQEELYFEDMLEIYGQFNFMVATRFHSALFAYASGVPAITIAYSGFKAQGIMKDLNMEDFSLEMRNLQPGKLIQLFDRMVAQRNTQSKKVRKGYGKLHALFEEIEL